MPIYEYHCDTCDQPFEKLIFRETEEAIACPTCGNRKVKRLLSYTCISGKATGDTCSTGAPKGFS